MCRVCEKPLLRVGEPCSAGKKTLLIVGEPLYDQVLGKAQKLIRIVKPIPALYGPIFMVFCKPKPAFRCFSLIKGLSPAPMSFFLTVLAVHFTFE